MVSGGVIGLTETTSQTQVFVEGADMWSFAESLPLNFGLGGHKGISLNNEIFIIGGGFYENNDINSEFILNYNIYKYYPNMDEWLMTGQLSEGRVFPAVSDLPMPYVKPYCQASMMKNVDKKTPKNITIPVETDKSIPFLKGVLFNVYTENK